MGKRKFRHNSKCPEEKCNGILKNNNIDPYGYVSTSYSLECNICGNDPGWLKNLNKPYNQ